MLHSMDKGDLNFRFSDLIPWQTGTEWSVTCLDGGSINSTRPTACCCGSRRCKFRMGVDGGWKLVRATTNYLSPGFVAAHPDPASNVPSQNWWSPPAKGPANLDRRTSSVSMRLMPMARLATSPPGPSSIRWMKDWSASIKTGFAPSPDGARRR